MKNKRIEVWFDFGAKLTVILGMLLVVLELAQNRETIRAQTRNEIAVTLVDLLSHIPNNPQLAEVVTKALAEESLTPSEALQFEQRIVTMLRYFENVHYQYREGLYDEAEFLTQREAWRIYYANVRPNVEIWCKYRKTFSSEFRVSFDSLIIKPCSVN